MKTKSRPEAPFERRGDIAQVANRVPMGTVLPNAFVSISRPCGRT
jgi:hypothetical protein